MSARIFFFTTLTERRGFQLGYPVNRGSLFVELNVIKKRVKEANGEEGVELVRESQQHEFSNGGSGGSKG